MKIWKKFSQKNCIFVVLISLLFGIFACTFCYAAPNNLPSANPSQKFIFPFSQATLPHITNYTPTFIPCFDPKHHAMIAIRVFKLNNESRYLLVNPNTLQTKTMPIETCSIRESRDEKINLLDNYSKLFSTLYLTVLSQYTSPPFLLQNYGVTHASHSVDGYFLTIDLCPSRKKFESAFFNQLKQLEQDKEVSIPIALSVSGLWMIHHPQEFSWLIDQEKNGKFSITWINHSFSHLYFKDLPLDRNFMLFRPTDFTNEVLMTEKYLLEHGQTPSIFFRFPGLISNKGLIMKLRYLGLIPIGTDAWLAKGQSPTNGSIILVHGNSNEPAGIAVMRQILKDKNTQLLSLNQLFL